MHYYQKLIDNAEETYVMEDKTHYVGSIARNELDDSLYDNMKRDDYIDEEQEGILAYDFFDYWFLD